MPSTFTGANPQVDVIQDPGPNMNVPPARTLVMHMRDAVVSTQGVVLAALAEISQMKRNGWVTGLRIADRAVGDRHISSVAASKVVGTVTNTISSDGNVTADGDVTASGFLRAGAESGNPYFRVQRYGGVLSSTGLGQVPHAVALMHRRVAHAEFWYEGGAGEALPCKVTQVNGDLIFFRADGDSGATNPASRRFRGVVIYTQDSPAW